MFVVHLWNPHGSEPETIWQVLNRQKDILYASRAVSHTVKQKQLHRLRHVVSGLVKHIPEQLRQTPEVQSLAEYGCLTRMHVVRLLAPTIDGEDHTKDIDFSLAGIRTRSAAGYADTSRLITMAPWEGEFDPMEGVILHEARAGIEFNSGLCPELLVVGEKAEDRTSRDAATQWASRLARELRRSLGDSGLSDAGQSRGAKERAGFDDADEYLHRSQPIHGQFLQGIHAIALSGAPTSRGTDDLSTATKPKERIMKFEGRPADAFRQVGLVVNDAGIPNVAPLTPWHKDRPAAGRAAAMLAFLAGLLVAALGAWAAGEPARPRPTDERAARTASARSRPQSSSRSPISPTSAPATRATSTSSIASSSVCRRRRRRVPAFGQRQMMTPPGALDTGRALDRGSVLTCARLPFTAPLAAEQPSLGS